MVHMWSFLVVFGSVCYSYNGPEVEIPLGKVRGLWKRSTNGNEYSSFEGIPYAKPPIGNLRFEEPLPIEPWQNTWNATQTYICLQMDLSDKHVSEGSEDCLYLNVYVPGKIINPDKNYDVLVHIHGGAFISGKAHVSANSTFIMNHEDIILVSMNYRLGPIGFLSTEDKEIPGNNGMKDQVLALKWIKSNIKYFGGNSNSITISGCSAGGASVHLHLLSPLSRGLFHRAISHSGVALNPWAIKEEPLVFTKNLSAQVGCPTSSTKSMKECLKKIPSDTLIKNCKAFLEYENMPLCPFAVVVEKSADNAFLSEYPYQVINNGKIADIPWIVSITKDEGMIITAYFCSKLGQLSKDFNEKVYLMLDYNHTLPVTRRKEFASTLRSHYLGVDMDINEENIQKFSDMCTHRSFLDGIETALKMHSKVNKSPVYYYKFSYTKGENSIANFICKEKKVKGTCHCDDIFYIYGMMPTHNFSESDMKLTRVFKTMITRFVKGKEPLLKENLEWPPIKGDELTYLNILDGEDIKIEKTKSLIPEGLWNDINKLEYGIVHTKTEL